MQAMRDNARLNTIVEFWSQKHGLPLPPEAGSAVHAALPAPKTGGDR